MRNRAILAALITGLLTILPAQGAWAQETAGPGGICAPWHRCLAYGGLGLAIIGTLGLFLGYLVQRRGFDKLEHRQGNPEGVPADER